MADVKTDNSALTNAYYEKLKKELKDLIAKKRVVDKNLNNLEENVYKHEGAYLEDTQHGNIIRGFDNYLKGSVNRRKTTANDTDRLFSLSSATYLRTLQRDASMGPDSDDARASGRKKKRRKDESSSGSEGDASKRARISFAQKI